MKLYDFSLAPNPRRVRMFLAEKALVIPSVQINTREQEQFSAEFRAVSPGSVVPVLELDDGTCISESVAICRYFEEIQPAPPLMGVDARDKALVEMWNRRVEWEFYARAAEVVRNGLAMFADRALPGLASGVPQIPALVDRGKAGIERFFGVLENQLATHQFVAGERFTIADITAYITIDFAKRVEIAIPADCGSLRRWSAEIAARPSVNA